MQWFECLDVAVRIMASEPLFYVKVFWGFFKVKDKNFILTFYVFPAVQTMH